jgi:hypothetical protein
MPGTPLRCILPTCVCAAVHVCVRWAGGQGMWPALLHPPSARGWKAARRSP